MNSYFLNPEIKWWGDADISTAVAHFFEQARTLWPRPNVAAE
jgi:hypothetical protein